MFGYIYCSWNLACPTRNFNWGCEWLLLSIRKGFCRCCCYCDCEFNQFIYELFLFLCVVELRPLCWLEHLSLHNETGLDPPGIRVRAVPGLAASDNFASGYLVWAVLIEILARIGYEGKNSYMAAYDWRLSFQNTEVY